MGIGGAGPSIMNGETVQSCRKSHAGRDAKQCVTAKKYGVLQ
jgi:hypothetical protein